MTETARKTLEAVEKTITEQINKEVEKKTLGEACDDAMMALGILSGVINKVVNESDDPIVGVCGATLSLNLVETTKAIGTFNQIYEASEIVREQEKNKR